MDDPFKVLGISHDATETELNMAYHKLKKLYDPENFADETSSASAKEKMQEIDEAYQDVINRPGFNRSSGQNDPKETLTGKKKADNFWFYHKWKIFAGIFVAIVLVVTVSQMLSNRKEDLSILFVSNYSPIESQTDALSNNLAKYTTDRDKNGDIYVAVKSILVGDKVDGQMAMAGQQKLLAEITTADSLVYLVNEEQYQSLMKQKALANLNQVLPSEKSSMEYRISWKNLKIRKGKGLEQMPDDLYFVMRVLPEAKNAKQKARIEANKSFLEKIISDQVS